MNCPVCHGILLIGFPVMKEGCSCKDIQCGICKTIFRIEIKVLKETSLTKEQILSKFQGGHNISNLTTYDEKGNSIPYPVVKKGK